MGSKPSSARRAKPAPETGTFADRIDFLWHRRGVAITVALLAFGGVVIATAFTTPTYEATASILPVNERDSILAFMQSTAFAEDVANRLDRTDSAVGLKEQVDVAEGTGRANAPYQTPITITAKASTARQAATIANAYVATLQDWDERLREVTWGKNWEPYYEAAGKNATLAEADLRALVDGMIYWQPLDEAALPTAAVSPRWEYNLALGATLAFMLGLSLPFVFEATADAVRERRWRATQQPKAKEHSSDAVVTDGPIQRSE